jgi:hypothetical protein
MDQRDPITSDRQLASSSGAAPRIEYEYEYEYEYDQAI